MKIRPCRDQILVAVERPETDERGYVSEGGVLHQPDYEWAGTVRAVGPGARNRKGYRIPCNAEPGTRVLCESHHGMLFDVEPYGQHMLIADEYVVAESDIPPA